MIDSPSIDDGNEEGSEEADIHLDVEKGLKILGGREKIYRKMLETFFFEYEHADEKIVKYLQAGDIESAHRLAHSIKSAAGQIGSTPLFTVAALLEGSIAENQVNTDILLSSFKIHLKAVLSAISAYLKLPSATDK